MLNLNPVIVATVLIRLQAELSYEPRPQTSSAKINLIDMCHAPNLVSWSCCFNSGQDCDNCYYYLFKLALLTRGGKTKVITMKLTIKTRLNKTITKRMQLTLSLF